MARHFGARVRDLTEGGRRILTLENEHIRVELLPDKGSDIVSFVHKASDTDVLWRSPMGLAAPNPGGRRPGSDLAAYMDEYEGGWQECLPNGGLGVTYRGAEVPFHGELWASSWDVDIEVDTPETVRVALRVETPRTPSARTSSQVSGLTWRFSQTKYPFRPRRFSSSVARTPSTGASFRAAAARSEISEGSA